MIKTSDVELNVSVDGSGPPIVFVHGFTTTSNFWWHQIPDLAKRYRTVRFDLRGHGDSGKPRDIAYTIEGFGDDLRNVMDTLGIGAAAIVGLSMGGAVAMRFALDHPGRVKALGLVGTSASGFGPMVQARNVLARIAEIGIEAASEEVIVHSFDATTDEVIVEWARREVVKTPRYVAEPAIRSLDDFDVQADLPRLRMPTLVVVGENDAITPESSSRLLHNAIPDSELHVVPKAAHFPMLERPHTFNQIALQFLRRIGY
ncbi:MAG: alpha/beta hydrolase [Burkholderiales bacterium]|nr:alpha/beta hydrolase [Burkholderiales bacterium]